MAQRDYAKILASLNVKRNQVNNVGIMQPVKITDYKTVDNQIIVLKKGQISWEDENGRATMKEGDMFFLPELSSLTMTYGVVDPTIIDKNQFTNYQDQYLKLDESGEGLKTEEEPRNGYFDVINFNAKIYEAIDFFKFVNISAFKIEDNKRLHVLFQDILKENEQDRIGQEELLQNLTQCLVIELIRHIIENQLFLDKLVLKSASLTDLRLTTLFKYIANNIAGDLSNPVLARVINLSRDYIGQYFKNITGDNLQKYVEIVRLQHAEKLLKHNPSIRIGDVAEQCGFADLAYFCRSFKEYWGTTARKMRTSYHRSKRVDLPIAVNG